jgi:hypothetical protein
MGHFLFLPPQCANAVSARDDQTLDDRSSRDSSLEQQATLIGGWTIPTNTTIPPHPAIVY